MSKTVHVIGNGDYAVMYKPAPGLKITCNLPPFEVKNVYGTCMVDFKMMKAVGEGSVNIDMYDWILGARPKKWMELQPGFYMQHAQKVKEFYVDLPDYAGNYTNFNCGHMAVHYAANKHKADIVHMYGFDSLFDFNLRSITDLYLYSDRGEMNTARLTNNWRPVWQGIFNEFSNTQFVIHHKHNAIKFKIPENVEIVTQ
jgi:hypothetical protein